MKIINPGNDTTTYRFHCKCGCVYEVAEWELQYSSEDCKFWHKGLLITFSRHSYTHCPRCGNKIPTDYAEIVNSIDTLTETISEKESKSESTENCCENCAYLGTRNDDSHFCMIPGKTLSTGTCDQYKSIAEQIECTKLKEAAQFIHTYCINHPHCKGCPFDGGVAERCELVQTPCDWDTDL